MEKSNIAAKRETYLETIIKNRKLPDELKKDVVYLDESYVHTSYKLKKCWQSVDVGGIKENVSKGKRCIKSYCLVTCFNMPDHTHFILF